MSFNTTISKVERLEVDFKRDASDPIYSFLEIMLWHPGNPRPDKLQIFPSSPAAADHLHRVFLTIGPPSLANLAEKFDGTLEPNEVPLRK